MHGTETLTGNKTTGGTTTARGSTVTGVSTAMAMGSRATGGTTTVTSGTTTQKNEGDGQHTSILQSSSSLLVHSLSWPPSSSS